MSSDSCFLCLQPSKGSYTGNENENQDDIKYKETILECSRRLVGEKMKNNPLLRENSSNNSSSPYCQDCFPSLEILWKIEEKLRKIKEELRGYIKIFTKQVFQSRVIVLSRIAISNPIDTKEEKDNDSDLKTSDHSSSCILCFDTIGKNHTHRDGEYDYANYKKIIFQSCERLLTEKVKGDSFNWTYSSDTRSPFCAKCFKISEKLWKIDENLKPVQLERNSYVDVLFRKLLKAKVNELYKKASDAKNEGHCRIIEDSDDDSDSEDNDTIPCVVPRDCKSVVSLSSANAQSEIIIETFKEEPLEEPLDFDESYFDTTEPDFSIPVEDQFNVEDWLTNNEKSKTDFAKSLPKPESVTEPVKNIAIRELRICVERLQLDRDGKVILPNSSNKPLGKRKAAVAAAAFLRNEMGDKNDNVADDALITGDIVDELSDYHNDDSDWNSDSEEEIIKRRKTNKSQRGKRKSRQKHFQCVQCSLKFQYSRELDTHSKESGHVNERTFVCTIGKCDKKYYRKANLSLHLSTHNSKTRTCKFCGKVCDSFHQYNAHYVKHYRQKWQKTQNRNKKESNLMKKKGSFQCSECLKMFPFSKDLDAHSEESGHVNERAFICTAEHCDRKYYRRKDLTIHKQVHDSKSRTCKYCGKVSETFHKHTAHLSKHERGEKLKFVKLSSISKTAKDCEPTMKKKDSFQCSECLKMFPWSKDLDTHSEESGHVNERTFICTAEHCDRKYYRRIDLTIHKQIHDSKSRTCKYCGKVSETFYKHTAHLNKHNRGEKLKFVKLNSSSKAAKEEGKPMMKMKREPFQFRCTALECEAKFTFARQLDEHSKESGHVNERTFTCAIGTCQKKYYTKFALCQHRQTHASKTRTCKFCGKVSDTFYQHLAHLNKHYKNQKPKEMVKRSYQCKFCERCYTNRTQLAEHMNRHTGDKPFKCNECPAAFFNYTSQYVHKKDHTSDKVQCPICHSFYKNEPTLTYHMKNHSDEHRKHCDSCDMSFEQVLQLNAHKIAVHGAKSPYKCINCEKCFPRKNDLNFHVRVMHEGKPKTRSEEGPPYICEICGKKYKQADSLSNHRYNAHNNSDKTKTFRKTQNKGEWKEKGLYPCMYLNCGRVFYQPSKLAEHIKVIHTKELIFTCHICEKQLKSSQSLYNHLQIHEGNFLSCTQCGRGFITNYNLKKHIHNVHEQNKPLRMSFTKTLYGKFKHATILTNNPTATPKNNPTE